MSLTEFTLPHCTRLQFLVSGAIFGNMRANWLPQLNEPIYQIANRPVRAASQLYDRNELFGFTYQQIRILLRIGNFSGEPGISSDLVEHMELARNQQIGTF